MILISALPQRPKLPKTMLILFCFFWEKKKQIRVCQVVAPKLNNHDFQLFFLIILSFAGGICFFHLILCLTPQWLFSFFQCKFYEQKYLCRAPFLKQ